MFHGNFVVGNIITANRESLLFTEWSAIRLDIFRNLPNDPMCISAVYRTHGRKIFSLLAGLISVSPFSFLQHVSQLRHTSYFSAFSFPVFFSRRERLMQILLPDSAGTYHGAITWFVVVVCKLCMLTRLELINYASQFFTISNSRRIFRCLKPAENATSFVFQRHSLHFSFELKICKCRYIINQLS